MSSPHGSIIKPHYCNLTFPEQVNITQEIIDEEDNRWTVNEHRQLTFNGKVHETTATPVQFVIYFDGILYTHSDPIDGWIVQWHVWKDGKPSLPGCYRMMSHQAQVPMNDHQNHCDAHSYLKRLVRGTEYRLRGMHGEM